MMWQIRYYNIIIKNIIDEIFIAQRTRSCFILICIAFPTGWFGQMIFHLKVQKKLKYLICNRHSYRKKKKFLFIKSFQKMKIALVCQYDIGIWWLLDIWKSFIFYFTPKLHYPLEKLGLVILITPRNCITLFLCIQRWDTSWWILCLV